MFGRLKKRVGRILYASREAARQFRSAYSGVIRQSSINDPVFFEERAEPNAHWHLSRRGRLVTWVPRPLINANTKVMAIGSCFAVEIRNALRRENIDVYPKYSDITFDVANQKIGDLPARDNLNHYDTFNIRQEFERALEGSAMRPDEVLTSGAGAKPYFSTGMYTDPYRPGVHATSPDALLQISQKLDACFREAVEKADVYIITLGLIECWKNTKHQKFVWGAPVKSWHLDTDHIQFHLSSFAENYENVHATCKRLLERYPNKKIILTVSPVALGETFSGTDVVIANTESKSILRTVAGQISREFENVIYWPSYELATRSDVYTETGRHVRDSFVAFIVGNFIRATNINREVR